MNNLDVDTEIKRMESQFERPWHYVPMPPGDPDFITRAIAYGTPVRASCGTVFVPRIENPGTKGLPACPMCARGTR